MVTAGQAARGAGKDGRVVALPPLRQAGPPAEGFHHMMVALSRVRVALCCGAPVVRALSGNDPAESLANAQFIYLFRNTASKTASSERHVVFSTYVEVGSG